MSTETAYATVDRPKPVKPSKPRRKRCQADHKTVNDRVAEMLTILANKIEAYEAKSIDPKATITEQLEARRFIVKLLGLKVPKLRRIPK